MVAIEAGGSWPSSALTLLRLRDDGRGKAFRAANMLFGCFDLSLTMHSRWQVPGNRSQLAVYPGGVHGFNSFTGELAQAANLRMAHFLARVRAVHPSNGYLRYSRQPGRQ